MSLNKVLNRPMFRKEALRKGVLKTINANDGIMVGQPYTGAPVPAIRKPPTAFERFKVSGPVRGATNLIKSAANIPAYYGFTGGMKVGEAMGINDPVGQTLSGLGGAYAASRALPALAGIGFLPSAIGIASIEGVRNRVNAGIELRKKINAMSPEERKAFEIENRNKAFSYMGEGVSDADLFGKFVPKTPEPIDTRKSAAPKEGPGSGRPSGFGKNSKTLKAEGDPLLQDNVANSEDIADLDSVQENSLGGATPPGGEDGITNYTDTKTEDRERRKQIALTEAKLTVDEKKQEKQNSQSQGNNEIALGGPSDDVEFNKTIALAKRYQEEVFKGEGSQAKLVFLANLASGLLTGTTRNSGIGGALEVFGQALGPAVNNYATIKLKEGELRARNREASLNAAVDHMKFLNDAAIVERPDVDPGVVQFRGADGKLRNYSGYIGKGGTTYLPGGLGPDGKEQLIPISQSGAIKDSEGNVLGSFENFQKQDKINNRLFEISDILGNRYNALSVARDVLKTLNQMDESGEQVKGGAALKVDQFTRRFSGVAKELVGLNVLDNDISQMSLSVLEDKMNQLQEDEFAAIDRSDLSDEAKKEAKEEISKKTLLKKAKDKLKNRGMLSGLTREEQEKLAVQEVTLTYALANTFKDQDRLTQRDVNAAKEIVNIFSLGRSSADVRASINAIANQLESDIRRQEELFRDAGGLESRITNLRGLAEFETFNKGTVEEQLLGDLSLDEIENIIEGIN